MDYETLAARFIAAYSKLEGGDHVLSPDVVIAALRLALTPPPLPPQTAPVASSLLLPPDVARAIASASASELSDPFVARRLAAHWRQGAWSPTPRRRD